MRLLLLYGYAPSGHASAAAALSACAESRGVEARKLNVSADYHTVLGPLVARLYLGLVRNGPSVWHVLYDNQFVAFFVRNWRWLYVLLLGGRARAKLVGLNPDVIVCTHATPLGAVALQKERTGAQWPLVAVTTDFRVHGYWVSPSVDLYLTATYEAAQALAERGVPAEKIKHTGIPIHPAFAQPLARSPARAALGLPLDVPVVLLSGGSRGLGRLRGLAAAILAAVPRGRVLVVCGGNEALFKALKSAHDQRLWVYGEVPAERMKELMSACDLLVGKGGGVTTAEALAVGLPIVLTDVLPGQEERNAEYLTREGAAVTARGVSEAAGLLRELLGSKQLDSMRLKARALGRPDSARAALEAILALAPPGRN